jgi:hypothetical protein
MKRKSKQHTPADDDSKADSLTRDVVTLDFDDSDPASYPLSHDDLTDIQDIIKTGSPDWY